MLYDTSYATKLDSSKLTFENFANSLSLKQCELLQKLAKRHHNPFANACAAQNHRLKPNPTQNTNKTPYIFIINNLEFSRKLIEVRSLSIEVYTCHENNFFKVASIDKHYSGDINFFCLKNSFELFFWDY